jgi:hypothetical protein
MYTKDTYHTFFYRNTTLLILSSHFTDVGWNPAHGEVYSMQLYMIILSVICRRSVVLLFPPSIKLTAMI